LPPFSVHIVPFIFFPYPPHIPPLHVPAVSHWLGAGQLTGVPVHTPAMH
jgi:hypothetical protein